MALIARTFIVLTLIVILLTPSVQAGDVSPKITIGTQEIGLTAGYFFPHLLSDRKSKTEQHGPAFMPSWMMTLTEPLGEGWYRGQISLGAEMAYIQFEEPILTHGIGFNPRAKYTFVALGRFRPYIEFAGGPFWTDLGGKIPEQSTQFNFIVSGGVGLNYFLTNHAALNIGYRFHHISNAHTGERNVGLNASLPFAGFSLFF